jgi:outer membrane protein
MKTYRILAAIAFLASVTVSQVAAQQARPGATPPTTTAQANIPDTKIALIDSSAFSDEKVGIARLVTAIKRVDTEFQPRRTELQALQTQYEKAAADYQKVAPMQPPQVNQQQTEKIDQMKRDITRKQEDAQAAFQKRLNEVLAPISDEIGKALDVYAKARGITLVLDVANMQDGFIRWASEATDITKAFIVEFNSKNPATASLAPQP